MVVKNTFDLILSLILILLLSPLMILVVILVRAKLGSKVIFFQLRPGKNDKIFTIYKFRTMTDEKDQYGNLLSDKKRLTRFGKFLRRTTLDELPQLFNVVKGDMSFVGPRALLVKYLPLYSSEQRKRHLVKPGITGWAQVNGRNSISWEQKFKYDLWYVENKSFFLDMRILFLTVVKVFQQSGISASDHATMPFFEGDKKENSSE